MPDTPPKIGGINSKNFEKYLKILMKLNFKVEFLSVECFYENAIIFLLSLRQVVPYDFQSQDLFRLSTTFLVFTKNLNQLEKCYFRFIF